MDKSTSIKELAAALTLAQEEMKPVPMNSVNPFLKNRFADLGAMIEASRPILARHALSLSQFPVTTGHGEIGITTILMHASGEWMENTVSLPVEIEKGKSSAQVAGSIITYLRRYSWASVLGLYADEDTDGVPAGHADAVKASASASVKSVSPRDGDNGRQAQPNTKPEFKIAKIVGDIPEWQKICKKLAQDHHRYQAETGGKPNGQPNYAHILMAAAAEGFPQVTPQNYEVVIESIYKRAGSKAEPA